MGGRRLDLHDRHIRFRLRAHQSSWLAVLDPNHLLFLCATRVLLATLINLAVPDVHRIRRLA